MLSRNNYLDFIKGIAIIFVIVGHVVQFSLGKTVYHSNPLLIFICSFHMPLFMAISGYLFYYSIKKTTFDIIKNKFHQLIVPLFLWTFIFCVLRIMNTPEDTFLHNVSYYFRMLPRQYWFLVVLFISSIILSISYAYLDKWYYHILIIVFILLIPDFSSIRFLKFMYPIFLLGFLHNQYSTIVNKYLIPILLLSCSIFITGLYSWKKSYFVYFTPDEIFNKNGFHFDSIRNHLIRYSIGISGSVVVLYASKLIFERFKLEYIQEIGKETLGIYLIHFALLELISYKQLIVIPDWFYLQVLINSLLLLFVSFSFAKLFNMWSLSRRYLLGKYNKKQSYSLNIH